MAIGKPFVGVQSQYLGNLLGRGGPGQILLVGQNEEGGTGQLLLRQQILQLGTAQLQAVPVGAVDDPDQPVGPLEVVAPVGPDGLLTTDVPKIELVSAMLESFDVESQGGLDGIDRFAGEFAQNRRLPGIVQSQYQQPKLLLLFFDLFED